MFYKFVERNGAPRGASMGEDEAADGRQAVEGGRTHVGPALPAADIWQ